MFIALLVRKYNISPALPMSQAGEKHPYVLTNEKNKFKFYVFIFSK